MVSTKFAIGLVLSIAIISIFSTYTIFNYNEGNSTVARSLESLFKMKDLKLTPSTFGNNELELLEWTGEIAPNKGEIRSIFCDNEYCFIGRYTGGIEKIDKSNGHSKWKRNLGYNSYPYGESNHQDIADALWCDNEFCYIGYNEKSTKAYQNDNHLNRLAKIKKTDGSVIWGSDNTQKLENGDERVISDISCSGEYCYITRSFDTSLQYSEHDYFKSSANDIARVSRSTGSGKVETVLKWEDGMPIDTEDNDDTNMNLRSINCDDSKRSKNYCFITANRRKEIEGGTWKASPTSILIRVPVEELDGSNNGEKVVKILCQEANLQKWCPGNPETGVYRGNMAYNTVCDTGKSNIGYCYTLFVGFECNYAETISSNDCLPHLSNEQKWYIIKQRKSNLSVISVAPVGGKNGISKQSYCYTQNDNTKCTLTLEDTLVRFNQTNLNKVYSLKTEGKRPNLIHCDELKCYISGTIPIEVDVVGPGTKIEHQPYLQSIKRSSINE